MSPEGQSRPGQGGSDDDRTEASVTPFQLLPPLTGDEYAALKADIAANGVLVPIIVDQHGVVIDGHHRQKIAEGLGIPYEQKVRWFADDEERYELALGLNLKRRHLNREQMRELIATECKRTPGASDREIARRLGCSHRTVAAVRRPEPVDKLSTPLSREDAEALTESIRRHLDKIDQDCIDLLTLGAPPTTVADVLKQMWAEAREQINDAEVTDAMWRYMVAPRVEAILRWPA
jgi:ParB-like chromosome segregation protein Spo0J